MTIKIGKNHKIYNHYHISEINAGDFIQLGILKSRKVFSLSTHIKVLRIDPTGSGKIIGQGECSDKGKEYLFHVKYIERNYSINPIIPGKEDYKNSKVKEFSRIPNKIKR